MRPVESVRVEAGLGIVGDRYHGSKHRHITVRPRSAGALVFSNGATQVFDAGGGTTYIEEGRPTRGEWYIDDDGHFGSFWPPSYRASYDLHWMVEDGAIVGLRFTELGRGSRFDGRYRD